MKLCLFMLALLLVTSASLGQQKVGSASHNLKPFDEIKAKETEVEGSDFVFSAAGYKYTVLHGGRGRREGGGGSVRHFNLRLEKRFPLSRVLFHAEHQGDLLLICEVSNVESGSGFITRLDGRTLAMKWKRTIPAFNVGPGLIENNHAYVTAIGFVGKVNLESGVYAWKHANLYRSKASDRSADFNAFELPTVEGDLVLFKESEISRTSPRTIAINKRSGRIVRSSSTSIVLN